MGVLERVLSRIRLWTKFYKLLSRVSEKFVLQICKGNIYVFSFIRIYSGHKAISYIGSGSAAVTMIYGAKWNCFHKWNP